MRYHRRVTAGVILFDIDGTLVDCGGAGRAAIAKAFDERFGRPDACDSIVFGGMTDRAIVRQGLAAIGVPAEEPVIDAVIAAYLKILEQDLPSSTKYRELEGGRHLATLARQRGHAVGLGTGNVRAGAQLKLVRADLWNLFDFGGFGCDAEARDVLLGIGRARGGERLGAQTFATLVVGDTPRDIHAARAIGARCLAVATGRFSAKELEAEGADAVVATLTASAAIAAMDTLLSEGA